MLPAVPDSIASQLLDAQVAWLMGRLTGDELPDLVAEEVDELLEIGSRLTLTQVVDAELVKQVAHDLLAVVPPSTGATTLVEMVADVLYDGAPSGFTLAEVVDRENVERLTDEVLSRTHLVESVLDDLTEVPLVTGMASRFVSKIVTDVLNSNRAVAEKIPGVGSIVSLGANAAGKMIGAADKQLEAVLGDTASKGAAFAMRRLNRIVVDIIKDDATRAALMEVFDRYADRPVPPLSRVGEREDVQRVAGLIQDIVIAGAPTEPVIALVDTLVEGLFATYGDEPAATLVTDLGVDRDLLVQHATPAVRRVLGAAQSSGDLQRVLRSRLEPFFTSPEVAAILG